MNAIERLKNVFAGTDNEKLLNRYSQDIDYLVSELEGRQIEVPEIYFLPFWNHVLQMKQRLENGSPISEDGMEFPSGISEENISFAEELIRHFNGSSSLEGVKGEVGLLSLYLNLFTNGYSEEEGSD